MAALLPLRTKLMYASSSLGSEALAQSRGAWLLYYYAPPPDADIPELLAPGIVAGILLAAPARAQLPVPTRLRRVN